MVPVPHDNEHETPSDVQALCDPETGTCALPGAAQTSAGPSAEGPVGEVLYVGDPMCSWCWGGSPGLRELEAEAIRRGIPFRIRVGGLRAGGGDPWNERFKGFLRHHWEEIAARTGQPFSTRFLDRAEFNYDTEPACRAFLVMRGMLEEMPGPETRAYEVFASMQRKFYADGEDPTVAAFYESICAAHGLDFRVFLNRFDHADAKRATANEFQEVRALGVSGFPTVLFRGGAGLEVLASGFMTGPRMLEALARATKRARSEA
ncbi:DsbA family protein [Corallococcus sp. AB030]|uniref:DsbA family protein n=1 Tax=Corallococcus sp. AB030 TaxID=2316716 RepID=UPI000EDE9A58|nr:DsbA family protein [Corallococcus sp. AB030]RKI12003.1 DsbA family protein [Corallococcus sp. AB030]